MENASTHSIARNAGVMLTSQAFTWISGFALLLVLPRYLGSEDFGRLFLAITVTTIVQVFIDFGGPYILPKEVARSTIELPSLYVNALASRMLLWLAAMVMLMTFVLLADYDAQLVSMIAILGTAKAWESANKVNYGFFQGREMMQYPCIGNIADRLMIVTVGIPAVLLGTSAVGVAGIMAASSLMSTLIVLHFRSRIIPHVPKVNWTGVTSLLRRSVPYLFWTVFSTIYYRVDAIVLAFFVPAAVLGWYGAAYRLFDALMFLPSILSIAVFPVLSRLRETNRETLAHITQRSLELIILAALPVSALLFLFAEPVIDLLFGLPGYASSVPVLRVLSVTLVLVYIDFVLSAALFACDLQLQWSLVAFVAILVNITLNIVVIPLTHSMIQNGAVGAAITTVMTEWFILICALSMLPKGVLQRHIPSSLLNGFASVAAAIVLVLFMRPLGYHWMLTASAGAVVYVTGLFALKTARPEEIALIRQFLSGLNVRRMFATTK